jgi:hypothetical protein
MMIVVLCAVMAAVAGEGADVVTEVARVVVGRGAVEIEADAFQKELAFPHVRIPFCLRG